MQHISAFHTKNSSYILEINPEGRLLHTHFGAKINQPEEILNNPLPELDVYFSSSQDKGFVRSPVTAFGTDETDEIAFKIKHADGNRSTDFQVISEPKLIKENTSSQHWTIELKDPLFQSGLILNVKTFPDTDVFEIWNEIQNKEKGPIFIEQAASSQLFFRGNHFWLTNFYGAWANEMNMSESELTPGIRILENKRGTKAAHGMFPGFILGLHNQTQEYQGEAIIGTLRSSGNFRMAFEQLDEYGLNLVCGINHFGLNYQLNSGHSFTTPSMIFTYSANGKNQASQNLHDWSKKNVFADPEKKRPIVLNSWEGAFFDINEKTVKEMIDGAAELGVELFVLDDGWFGNAHPRNNDHAGLGDWEVNKDKFPNGLQPLIDHAQSKGLKFGIWVEPEMVNHNSTLYQNHPDWIVQIMGRTPHQQRQQYVLDLTRPEVQNYIFKIFDTLLGNHPDIAYIKWDCNRKISDPGSTYLSSECQGNFYFDWVQGYHYVFRTISEKYPNIIFKACSAGGARSDFGTLTGHHEFWPSDNTDPTHRIFIQWGYTHFFPALAVAAHVSEIPNSITRGTAPLKFRFDVAMAGRLGVELVPSKLTKTETIFSTQAIKLYKSIRQIIQFGRIYRLESPYHGNRASILFISKDEEQAVLFCWGVKYHFGEKFPLLKLPNLLDEQKYLLEEINLEPNQAAHCTGHQKTFSGNFLMHFGLAIDFNREFDSAVFLIQKSK